MLPHSNFGINFRKHFSLHYSKKKALNKIREEESRINKSYKHHMISREEAMKMLNKLVGRFVRVKRGELE